MIRGMKFFQPTLIKVILTIAIFYLWYFWMAVFDTFWSCSLHEITSPYAFQLVHKLWMVGWALIGAIGWIFFPPLGCISGSFPLAINIAKVFLLILAYLLSCIAAALKGELRKLKKRK